MTLPSVDVSFFMVVVSSRLVIGCVATPIKPDRDHRLSKCAKLIVRYPNIRVLLQHPDRTAQTNAGENGFAATAESRSVFCSHILALDNTA